jgi:hypothetical protein
LQYQYPTLLPDIFHEQHFNNAMAFLCKLNSDSAAKRMEFERKAADMVIRDTTTNKSKE